jgi:hypothetical protein
MAFSAIGKFLPKVSRPQLLGQASSALALEAGTKFLVAKNPLFGTRVRLVSIRDGVVRARAISAPARAEVLRLREPLFKAMKNAANMPLSELYVEVRGSLADGGEF